MFNVNSKERSLKVKAGITWLQKTPQKTKQDKPIEKMAQIYEWPNEQSAGLLIH